MHCGVVLADARRTNCNGLEVDALTEDPLIDESNTNFTSGLHVGYFVLPVLSLGAEIRHQRWLSTPSAVKTNSAARDTTTFAVGPRFHFKLSEKVWFRPGVALALPIDEPMTNSDFKIAQLDLPLSF